MRECEFTACMCDIIGKHLRQLRHQHDGLSLLSTGVATSAAGLCILPIQAACIGQVSGQILQRRAAVTER